jgi:hypothetical protein
MISPFNLAFNLALLEMILVPVLAVRKSGHPQAFRVQKLGVTSSGTKDMYTVSKTSERIGMVGGNTHVFREWTNATFPDPIRTPTECGTKAGSHICDPESILSSSVLDAQDATLQRFETSMKSEYCPSQGFRVYTGIAHNIANTDGLRKAAIDLGRKWGVLGTPCGNGIVALCSLQDGGNLVIEVDDKLKEHMFPAKLVEHLERTPLGVLELRSPDDVIMSLVSELDLVLDGSFNSRQRVNFIGDPMVFFYAPVGFLGLIFALLMLCFVYDMFSHWRHRAHFMSCRDKLKRVHEVFQKPHDGELPLCPVCVHSVTNAPSSRVVVFLCGHRFHTDCSNRWFREHQGTSGRCPICELPHSYSCDHPKDNSLFCESKSLASSPVNVVDEVKHFFLSSIQHQYPEIIPESAVERWGSCHTEIWLSELRCPRYQTLFDKCNRRYQKAHLENLATQFPHSGAMCHPCHP